MTDQLVPEEQQFVDEYKHLFKENIPLLQQNIDMEGMYIEQGHIIRLHLVFIKMIPIHNSIQNLHHLQNLHINGMQINISSVNFSFPVLNELILGNVNEVPSTIMNLVQLQRLVLNSNNIQHLDRLGSLINLQSLQIDDESFPDLPDSLQNLTQLTTLKIFRSLKIEDEPKFNRGDRLVYSLPTWIAALPSLRIIELSNFNIIHIPSSPMIEELWISDSYVIDQELSLEEIRKYSEELLTRGYIQKDLGISEDFNGLPNLKRMILKNNHLCEKLPDFRVFHQLQELKIELNKLTTFPRNLSHCPYLRSLSLYSNQLTSVPEEIGNCQALEWINLGKNNLHSLPKSLGKLKNLKDLMLYQNPQLSEIPIELAELNELRVLVLSGTAIPLIPPFVLRLMNLKQFFPPIYGTMKPQDLKILDVLRRRDVKIDKL